jgi:ATP-dependent helicase HrpA
METNPSAIGRFAQSFKLSFNEKKPVMKIYRALLTGLLSFIANKTDERNIYMAVRQQKAKVFLPVLCINQYAVGDGI